MGMFTLPSYAEVEQDFLICRDSQLKDCLESGETLDFPEYWELFQVDFAVSKVISQFDRGLNDEPQGMPVRFVEWVNSWLWAKVTG